MTDSAEPIDAAEDADTDATTDTPDDAPEADATDGADADCTTDSGDSRKRTVPDPIERYLKALKVGRSPGFLSILGLLFVTLKLTGHIDWSWLWVLLPFLIKGTFMLLVLAGLVFAIKKKFWKPSGKT
ncbi:MAG: hypothetical protein OXI71_01275 [Gemmatimonadota bacterium]|nr:hypothetical protein [Gemmatimonadota bacterium]